MNKNSECLRYLNCRHARMAVIKGKIACSYLSSDYYCKNNYSKIFNELNLDDLNIG